jgi:hypothetical protein
LCLGGDSTLFQILEAAVTITLAHVLLGITISAIALVGIFFFTARSAKPVFPVRCVHCWMYSQKETVITFSDQRGLWGICPDCVELYWHFDEPEAPQAGVDYSAQSASQGQQEFGMVQ